MCVSFCTIWCIFSAQIASKLSQVYSHTNFSFEYIISLKIIHVEDFFVMQAWLIWKCYTKKFKNKQSQGVHFQSIWRYLHVFNVCAGLSKKALDMPLRIPKKLTFSEIYKFQCGPYSENNYHENDIWTLDLANTIYQSKTKTGFQMSVSLQMKIVYIACNKGKPYETWNILC